MNGVIFILYLKLSLRSWEKYKKCCKHPSPPHQKTLGLDLIITEILSYSCFMSLRKSVCSWSPTATWLPKLADCVSCVIFPPCRHTVTDFECVWKQEWDTEGEVSLFSQAVVHVLYPCGGAKLFWSRTCQTEFLQLKHRLNKAADQDRPWGVCFSKITCFY